MQVPSDSGHAGSFPAITRWGRLTWCPECVAAVPRIVGTSTWGRDQWLWPAAPRAGASLGRRVYGSSFWDQCLVCTWYDCGDSEYRVWAPPDAAVSSSDAWTWPTCPPNAPHMQRPSGAGAPRPNQFGTRSHPGVGHGALTPNTEPGHEPMPVRKARTLGLGQNLHSGRGGTGHKCDSGCRVWDQRR